MSLLQPPERSLARAYAGLVSGNPFLPERIEHERAALGPDFIAGDRVWHPRADVPENPNLPALSLRAERLADEVRRRLAAGSDAALTGDEDFRLYEDVVTYLLFYRYFDDFFTLIRDRTAALRRIDFYDRFLRDFQHYFTVSGQAFSTESDAPHLFACLFQVGRGFHFIHRNILGGAMPAARLRAAVWQSIFTRDIKRYRRTLYQHMGDITTLVTGPSGTGKELVARAIGLSRYTPFDPGARRFAEDFAGSFHGLNLAALSPTLIEAELFGHRRGAFTGALQDRTGWLEACPPYGTVFLDEIGEVDTAIQVKLLRVIQTRTFQRIGDSRDRSFRGKIVCATNRNLAEQMQSGAFRADLYYRLCADIVTTPSLREQLQDAPGELRTLLRLLAERIAGAEEAEALTSEVEHWIETQLGPDYGWPGNVRELEQCVRNIMIRGEYHPPRPRATAVGDRLAEAFLHGSITADELLRRYCTVVYAQTGSYLETARRLGLDRRTVRDKIDPHLLEELRAR